MSETEDKAVRPPRFPFVAALLCAACVGAAGWTWMRCSYAWDLRPSYLVGLTSAQLFGMQGRYLCLRGVLMPTPPGSNPLRGWNGAVYDPDDVSLGVNAYIGPGKAEHPDDSMLAGRIVVRWYGRDLETNRVQLRGRAVVKGDDRLGGIDLQVDTTASRFTGASIAGLVVGAMGVFVLTVALRHWLGERRRPRVEQVGPDTSVEGPPSAS